MGAKAANEAQNRLRRRCLEDGIWTLDLTNGVEFDWRALLAALSYDTAAEILQPNGVTAFRFRILRNVIDTNYRNRTPKQPWRHVFEVETFDGHRVHLHYHSNGTADQLRWAEHGAFPYY